MYKNGLIRKIRLISEFMTSQPGKQTIAMHLLPNISKSKGNQIMKFGLLKPVYEKLYTKCGEETTSRPFSYQNWGYIWINFLKFYTVCFYCMPSWGLSNYIKTEQQTTCFSTSYKVFLKNKKMSGTSLPASFSAWFLKKNISLAIVYWRNFIVWLSLFLEILGNTCIVIVC